MTHDVKLVREVKSMRMSDRDKNGFTMWRLRDSAVLVCPASHPDKQRSSHSMTSLPVSGGTTNQNQSYMMRMDNKTTIGQLNIFGVANLNQWAYISEDFYVVVSI